MSASCDAEATDLPGGFVAAIAVVCSNMMDVVHAAVPTVAAQEMAGSLSASADEAAWLNIAYVAAKMFAFAGVPLCIARTSMPCVLRGCVWLMLIADVGLLAGSGLQTSIALRALQGIGGGGVLVAGLAYILQRMPAAHHAWAQAAFSATTLLGPSLFAYLCGTATDASNWRFAMALGLPLGAAALLVLPSTVHGAPAAHSAQSVHGSDDMAAWYLWAIAAVGSQFIAARGSRYNWDDVPWMLPLCGLSAAALLAFAVRHRAQRQTPSLLQTDAFLRPEFRFACLTATASAYGAAASAMLVPLLLRQLFGYAAADVGITLLPGAAACALGLLLSAGVVATRIIDPVYLIFAGLALFAAAMATLGCATPQIDMAFAAWVLVLRSFAFGLMSVPTAVVAFSRLRGPALYNGVAIYHIVRQLGTTAATTAMNWRLCHSQADFSYQLSTHLDPTDPSLSARLATSQAHLLERGLSAATAGHAGIGQAHKALLAQVHVLAYRACCQEILLVFLGCMFAALLLRNRLVRLGLDGS